MGLQKGQALSLGLDYGTNSVRALIVDCADGEEVAEAVIGYPSGDLGVLTDESDPNVARQNTADYKRCFFEAVQTALRQPGIDASKVVGLGVDTTGSTPIPVDAEMVALCERPEFHGNLDAMAWLWKDHSGAAETEQINETCRSMGRPYLENIGGSYSSEWFWSKILHCAHVAPDVFRAAHSWVEFADYIPAWLCDEKRPKRGICAAGHKAMFHPDWGGLPDEEFLTALHPELGSLRGRLYDEAVPSDRSAGRLSAAIAAKAGLPAGIPVAVGAFDAHMGAVGSGITPGTLVKIMGTSTCDIMVGDLSSTPNIQGVCGVVPESVLPGYAGIEAGQSAVGDLFNWFVSKLAPPEFAGPDAHSKLNEAAAQLRPGESGLLALDWNNGNRTILVDPKLSGLIVGMSLQTNAAEVYRTLIEATAFGSLAIVRRIQEGGTPIERVVTGGGIAERSPLTMQIYSDVLGVPIQISRSGQTCALGAAIFGSVVGGAHPDTASAVGAMTGLKDVVYRPDPHARAISEVLFELYMQLHDAFGIKGEPGHLYHVMKELIALRSRVRRSA